MTNSPNSLQQDFAWCEDTIRRHSKSFYTAFSQLPEKKRQSVYAIYAFCRAADDSVDQHASAAMLAKLKDELDAFTSGNTPKTPMWRALEAVFGWFSISAAPFYDMLKGQQQDLAFSQPQTLMELEEYCYYVAGSVGLMLLPVLCEADENREKAKGPAIALGVAMQLTNILRDVGEDYANGRVYLPKGTLRSCGYTLRDLQLGVVNGNFRMAWETLATRAEELYLGMERGIFLLDEDSRLPTLSSLYLYRGILGAVRQNGYNCFGKRSFVPEDAKHVLLGCAKQSLATSTGAAH